MNYRNPLVTLFAAILLWPALAWGQGNVSPDQSGATNDTSAAQPGSDTSTVQSNTAPADTGEAPAPTDTTSQIPDQLQVTKLGGASWLEPGAHGPVHLGPIYMGNVSFVFLYGGGLTYNQVEHQVESETATIGVLTTSINYDKLFPSSRISLQYDPELAFVNGQFESTLSNQNVDINTTRLLTPRLSLRVDNNFIQTSGQILYSGLNLDVNTLTDQAVQKSFVQTSKQWIADTSTITLGYLLGPRDSMSVSPYFEYQHSDLPNLPSNSTTYGGTVSWSHVLSETQTIGLYGAAAEQQLSAGVPTALYESAGLTYSQRIRGSWMAQLTLGAGTLTGGGQPREWTGLGQLNLGKTFGRSTVGMSIYRGMSIGPVLTTGYSNLVDGTYSRQVTSRIQTSAGVGYQAYTQSQLSATGLTGIYATAQMGVRLSRSWSWGAGFSKLWEQNTSFGPNINSNNFSTSLTWAIAGAGVVGPTL